MHAVETMFYRGETPWHGLGTRVHEIPSIKAAMEAAGLNWDVALEAMHLADGAIVPDRVASVRQSDRKVLGVVSPKYNLVQNQEAFDFFQPFLDQGMATLETAGSLFGGRRVWVLARVQSDDDVIVPGADDRVARYLTLANSHDGSLMVRAGLTPIRVVCNNTLSAAVHGSGSSFLKISHRSNASGMLAQLSKTFGDMNAKFDHAAATFRALANVELTEASLQKFLDAAFPAPKPRKTANLNEVAVDGQAEFSALLDKPVAARNGVFSAELDGGQQMTTETKRRVHEKVRALIEGGTGNDVKGVRGTAWAALNGATEYLSHYRGGEEQRFADNFTGGSGSPLNTATRAAVATFLGS